MSYESYPYVHSNYTCYLDSEWSGTAGPKQLGSLRSGLLPDATAYFSFSKSPLLSLQEASKGIKKP